MVCKAPPYNSVYIHMEQANFSALVLETAPEIDIAGNNIYSCSEYLQYTALFAYLLESVAGVTRNKISYKLFLMSYYLFRQLILSKMSVINHPTIL